MTSSKSNVRDAVSSALIGVLAPTADLVLQFPAMKIALGALDGIVSVRDALLFKRIELFLNELDSKSKNDRAEFRDSVLSGEGFAKFGQTVLSISASADDFEKPKLCGRIVAASINGFLPLDNAYRICRMVNRAHSEDLKMLVGFKNGLQLGRELEAEALFAAGFLSFAGIDGGSLDGDGGTLYAINTFGLQLVNYAMAP